jgi:hypothetical protein
VPQTPVTSRARWVVLAFLLPFAVLAVHHWGWAPPTEMGDYAQYLAHARAIAEGRPYTDIGYIYHPAAPMLGPRAYPPGLPLTLAPIVALGGVHSPLIRVLMLATLVAFAYFAFRRLATDIAPWQAAIAVGFTTLAIEARFGTLVPSSDVGLCALLWATVLAVDSEGSWTWRRIALVTALGFAAIAYRIAGVAIVPALALYAILTWRRNRGRALIPVAIWGGASFAMLATSAISLSFSQYLIPRLSGLLERLAHIAKVYRLAVFDAELYPFASNAPSDVYHAIASLALLVGVVALLWRRWRTMLATTVVMYSALLVASPAVDARYLWPLYPVLAAGLVLGVSAVGRFLAQRVAWFPRSPLPSVGALAAIAIAGFLQEFSQPTPEAINYQPEARALQAWLREAQQRAPMRLLYSNPRVLTLETRVPAMPALIVPPNKQLQAMREEGITHLIWRTVKESDCRTLLANALPTEFPDRFTLEYSNAKWRVYRLAAAGESERAAAPQGPIRPDYPCNDLLRARSKNRL